MAKAIGRRFPVFGRGLASFGRWPTVRIIRVVALSVGAGLVAHGIWAGTTPLVLVGGLCLYMIGLDAIEPLAQEIDHPLLTDSYPEPRGILFQRHLVAPIIMMMITLGVGAVIAVALDPSGTAVVIAALAVACMSLTSVAGAAVSVVGEAILSAVDEAMMPPEVAGPRVVIRTIWPPFVALSGYAPVLGAQRAFRNHGNIMTTALWASAIPIALAVAVFTWVRYRDDLHDTMNEAMGR